ncbi:MAG TPA: DUF3501 family protein [Candidatus Tectomicrobia bacterium]|nr:DUF3501 family protein [Candidatus Tectomicrobia bacterium]
MRRVRRDEIVDHVTYEDGRAAFRARVLAEKAPRRVHIGEHLTLLFENTLTVQYQIQEMMRAERIVREADIVHEIETYNELLGGPGELGCTLLIEIDDRELRDRKLREWWALPERIALVLEDGTRMPARFDERQRGEGRLSSVQYLTFDVGGRTPVAVRVDLPGLAVEVTLSPETRRALAEDLASDAPAGSTVGPS